MNALPLPVLLSYHYHKDADLDAMLGPDYATARRVFADSGAFSAYTLGAEIKLAEYARWLKRWAHLWGACAALDVIGNARLTWDNTRRLADMGLDVLPVFHAGEEMDWLGVYAQEYDYIALGGLVGNGGQNPPQLPWLVRCFQAAPRARFHGFGMTHWRTMADLRWRSLDSSTYTAGVRFGELRLFDLNAARIVKAYIGNYRSAHARRNLIADYGFAWEDVASRARNTRALNTRISIVSYARAARWLGRRHGEADAPTFYFAAGSDTIEHLRWVNDHMDEGGLRV